MAQINITALRHSAFYSPLLMTICGGYLKDEGLDHGYRVSTHAKPMPDTLSSG